MAVREPSDDDLRQALQQEIPPREEARRQALAAALVAYDRENEKSTQGSRDPRRPISAVNRFFKLMGDWQMNQRTLALAATAALALVVVVTVLPGQLSLSPESVQTPREKADDQPAPRQGPAQAAANLATVTPAPADALKARATETRPAVVTGGQTLKEEATRAPLSKTMPAAPPATFAAADQGVMMQPESEERDRFTAFADNPVKVAAEEPVSTFSADVDTASYSFVRKMLNQGRLPPPDAVRVEEMINYFPYAYPPPRERAEPFATTLSLHPTPWNKETRLLHIGIKGFELPPAAKPKSHLTFLVDVSGSMNAPDKLPLLKQSLGLLVGSLDPDDTVAMVVYAGAAGTVLEPTPVQERHKILAALEKLSAGGSTAGGEGIRLAYALAASTYDAAAVNRVILATDGDFNVGIADPRALKGMVEEKRRGGVYLSVLGFGQGNYNDALMQELAQNGNGVAAYIDTLAEARKVLVEEASANLFTIAKDVKIQVEFNPERVAEYRLIGYETRKLAREDFKNDRVDAGEVGSGHAVTALYEVTPRGGAGTLVEPLRYGGQAAVPAGNASGEWAFIKIRYKLPHEEKSRLITRPVTDREVVGELAQVSDDLRFAAAVAALGERLRGGRALGDFGFAGIIALAQGAKGPDPYGYRAEFVNLARMAQAVVGK